MQSQQAAPGARVRVCSKRPGSRQIPPLLTTYARRLVKWDVFASRAQHCGKMFHSMPGEVTSQSLAFFHLQMADVWGVRCARARATSAWGGAWRPPDGGAASLSVLSRDCWRDAERRRPDLENVRLGPYRAAERGSKRERRSFRPAPDMPPQRPRFAKHSQVETSWEFAPGFVALLQRPAFRQRDPPQLAIIFSASMATPPHPRLERKEGR